MKDPTDPYARAQYRRVIAWDRRIAREGPWLRQLLERSPDASVLDLGCGTGEHVAFFAGLGARAVGLDRSEAMIEAAQDHGAGRFMHGDVADATELLRDEPPFGLAICLGNMLPHLLDDNALDTFLSAARECLLPGGHLVVQLLNYDRIIDTPVRTLPVNVRPGDGDEEIVFVRVMRPRPDGMLAFYPTTLSLDPEADEPISVVSTRRVELRAWRKADLNRLLTSRGFQVSWHGDMAGGPFEPAHSMDLVLVARCSG